MSAKKVILCDAAPFGFGPISKLLSIAKILRKKYSLVLLAFGPSLELAQNSGLFDKIIKCNTDNLKGIKSLESVFNGKCFFLNVMNFKSLKFAKKNGVPYAVVDSLFYMWDKIPSVALNANFYFIQSFLNKKARLNYQKKIKNLVLVNPILDIEKKGRKKKNQLVINFGGVEAPDASFEEKQIYPKLAIEMLMPFLKNQKTFSSILITGNKATVSFISKQAPKKIKCKSLTHEKFIKELKKSKLLLTSPGLTVSLEAFYLGIPTIFLLPQNHSQFFNLIKMRKQGLAKHSIHWIDFYPKANINETENEDKSYKKISALMKKFDKNDANKKTASQKLCSILEQAKEFQKIKKTQQQKTKFKSNGAEEIAEKIIGSIERKVI